MSDRALVHGISRRGCGLSCHAMPIIQSIRRPANEKLTMRILHGVHCAGKDGDSPVSVSATMPYVCDDVDDHEYDVRYRRRSLSRLGIGRSSLSATMTWSSNKGVYSDPAMGDVI
jgi:hypothetical protein